MVKILTLHSDILLALSNIKTIALVGASNKLDRPSYTVMNKLLDYGFKVLPVNPGLEGQQILGQNVFATLSDINIPIDMIDVFRNADFVPRVVEEMLTLNIKPKLLWTQLNIIHEAAAHCAIEAGINVVMDRCPVIELGLH